MKGQNVRGTAQLWWHAQILPDTRLKVIVNWQQGQIIGRNHICRLTGRHDWQLSITQSDHKRSSHSNDKVTTEVLKDMLMFRDNPNLCTDLFDTDEIAAAI